MKILHATNAVGWSGGMEQMSLLVRELQRGGHENLVACPVESELAQRLAPEGIPLLPVAMFQDYDLAAAWKLRRLIGRHAPDILHAHHAIAHAVSLLSVLFTEKPPLVISRRVSFAPRKNPFSVWKYRSRRISKYVVVSRSVRDTLVAGGVDPDKVEVIYSAVRPERFAARASDMKLRGSLGVPDGHKLVVKVANYSAWKGQHVFLEAAQKCLERRKDLTFLLIGKGTETLREEVAELGLGGNVKLLGFRADVPDLLALADASVNCAIEGEGLSGAMRESLTMGVPVVASDVAGNREIVRDGATGFLVPARDSARLAERILETLERPDAARALAAQGRRWVLDNATVPIMVERHLNLYRSLLG